MSSAIFHAIAVGMAGGITIGFLADRVGLLAVEAQPHSQWHKRIASDDASKELQLNASLVQISDAQMAAFLRKQ